MMEQIRNATKSWLALVIVGLLIISFAMWGVNDAFTTNSNDPVATVGGKEISQDEFRQQFNLDFRRASFSQGSRLTQAEALASGLDRQTLNEMIRREVVARMADEFGLATSDQLLQREITTNPSFAGPNGQFDQSTYYETLGQAGYFTPQQYEDRLREDLARGQLLGTLVSGFFLPQELAAAHYDYAFERRELEYFLLPPAAAGDIADPGEEVLQAYYSDNTSFYRAPEYRDLTLLKLSAQDLADDIDVAEEDIERLFEIREDRLQTPERRDIEQLTFASDAEAQTALNLLNAGGEFDNVGGTYIDMGMVAQDEGIDPAVMEAAFALEEPGVTGIIEGALSTSIVRVNEITPGETVTYAEVRDELRQEIAVQAAEEEIFAISNNAQDMMAGGTPLTEIGTQLSVPVFTAEAIARTGETAAGDVPEDFTRTQGVLRIAFDMVEGEDSGFRDTPEGEFFVVRVNGITAARTRDFEEVRDEVLEDWRRDEVANTLSAMARSAAEAVNGGEDFAAVAGQLGQEVRTSARALRRGDTSEIFSALMLGNLFTQPVGEAVSGTVQLGDSYVVARVTEVIPADPEANGQQVASLRTALEDRIAAELINLYVDRAEAELNVRINDEALDQALSNAN